jgi:hypothetical protein
LEQALSITKGRKVLIWALVVCGLPLLLLGFAFRGGSRADDPGPRPGAMLMTMAIGVAFHNRGNDPTTLEGSILQPPAVDQLGGKACWRFPFSYRVRTPLGGTVFRRGVFWVKDGHVLREQWDDL